MLHPKVEQREVKDGTPASEQKLGSPKAPLECSIQTLLEDQLQTELNVTAFIAEVAVAALLHVDGGCAARDISVVGQHKVIVVIQRVVELTAELHLHLF